MRIKVETLRHCLDVFLWEHPEWAKSDVVVENTNGGRVFARRPIRGKGFDITWEELTIYEDKARRMPDDSE